MIRPAAAGETGPALRLVLGGATTHVSDQNVQEFVTFAEARGIDLAGLWVAEQAGKLTQAALPVRSPGRTMLLFASPITGGPAAEAVLGRLIGSASRATAEKDVHLAQALIDPTDDVMQRVYTAAGFTQMAELIYLNGEPPRDAAPPLLPAQFSWVTYSPRVHEQFAEAIAASYHESLDCPSLNGVRDMEDVIEGHKASGVFDPNHWMLLCGEGKPLGVLLLAASGRATNGTGDVVELVYLGLAPRARGKKLGEVLVKQAMAVVKQEKHERLSLAVDARNVPALKLYYRHGMNRVAAKLAMMRDLRRSE